MSSGVVVGVPSQLDIFAPPIQQRAVESAHYGYYQSIAPLDQSETLEIVIPGSAEYYLDLSRAQLRVVGKFTDGAAGDLAAAHFYPVNNLLHSLFSQIDVYLNDHLVASNSRQYPIKAYLEKLLNYSDASKAKMMHALYYPDTPGHFDNASTAAGANVGGGVRLKPIDASKTFEMIDRLHLD